MKPVPLVPQNYLAAGIGTLPHINDPLYRGMLAHIGKALNETFSSHILTKGPLQDTLSNQLFKFK